MMSADHVLHAEDIFGADPLDDPLTEAGGAERFTRRHGDVLRFDHRRQSWLLREAHRWVPDADAGVYRLALDFARLWQHDALATITNRERREAVLKFTLRLERKDAIGNLLALARTMKPIADSGEGWDADPWLMACPNGVVDLRTGTRRDGRPEDRIRMATAVPYDPDADCSRWAQFVDEIMGGQADLVRFLRRAVGYSLTGITTEQVLFLLYGTGANGKGTFVNTLKRALGDYAWNMPFATIELRDRASIPNDVAALLGRRLVVASETNDGARLNEARVKALTGCDPMTARFLHGEFFTFEPVAKFWLSVNHKPIVRDDSYGFWRRLRLIPFTRTFAVDLGLADVLAMEASGILAWAVRGCIEWQAEGLAAPPAVVQATREYERDSDVLGAFLAESCELVPDAEIGAADLYQHYETWATGHHLSPREKLSSTAFGRKMAERFARDDRRGGRVYFGVARRVGG